MTGIASPLNARFVRVACPLCGRDEPRPELTQTELGLTDRSRTDWTIVRCGRCGLVYVNPRTEATPQQVYAGDDYGFQRSLLADWYTDTRSHADRVLDELGAGRDGRLLDVGCAGGELLVAARARGWQVAGIEVSPYAAGIARERGLDVRTGTLEETSFDTGSFDLVTLLDVIEHVPDPVGLLREVRRILAPGGRVVIETPNWASVYRRLLRTRWAALQPRVHIMYFDRRTLAHALRAAGFEPEFATTEIVALLSPEAARRGIGPSWPVGIGRDLVVRWRLHRPAGRIDRSLARIGPAARARPGSGSFKEAAQRHQTSGTPRAPRWAPLVRAINKPLDRALLALDMGEQLRMIARA